VINAVVPRSWPPAYSSVPTKRKEKPAAKDAQSPAKCQIGRRRPSGTMPVSEVE
jgi:hypothetical protein